MRGTSDHRAFQDFVRAVLGFPPTPRNGLTAEEVFQNSFRILTDLAELDPPFPRAIGWKAYALALTVYEGWPLPPEHEVEDDERLDLAKQLALRAVELDPTDFDVHWALADVCLIRGEFKEAQQEFEQALYLNGDERHPNLFAEAASAMMQIGLHDESDKLFRKAERRADWHHWMRGIGLFLRAGRSDNEQELLLDRALDELKSAKAQPGEDFYQEELQLMLAAVYWRKHEIEQSKLRSARDPEERNRIERNSARNKKEAEGAIRRFHDRRTGWDRDRAKRSLSLNRTDRRYWHETVDALWDQLEGGRPRRGRKGPRRKGADGPKRGSARSRR